MQVEAIYNQGRIELVQRLRLRHDQVRLIVTVPDEEVESIANPYNVSPRCCKRPRKCANALMRHGARHSRQMTSCPR